MKAAVVGYGSIGSRHARILSDLGADVAIVSRREVSGPSRFATIEDALEDFAPDLFVIANETSMHEHALSALAGAGYSGMVVVEKPLANQPFRIPENRFSHSGVAYNMRFHPVIERLKAAVSRAPALSVWAYVGQYLPLWRPQRDYRQSYSVSRSQGGGVLRDLSHEIDYLHHLFGDWLDIAAVGGHVSSLPGDSEDVVCLLARQERSRATGLQLNYLDRPGARLVVCNTDQHTFAADLVAGAFSVDGEREDFAVARDDSYRSMWLDVLSENFTRICSFIDAQRSLELIAAAEKAIATRSWVTV